MILFLLPESDYDPTEAAVPWAALQDAGVEVRFATPSGAPAFADSRLVDEGFSLLSPILMTRGDDLKVYARLTRDPHFMSPERYSAVDLDAVSGVFVPGGHAPGMKTMLESTAAQEIFSKVLLSGRPAGAVCHGVLLAARAKDPRTGHSVLYERRTTALTSALELAAWNLTRVWLGSYYRTYSQTVQSEVTAALRDPNQFESGPLMPRRDTAADTDCGFIVRDGNYVSGRWPGDCHRLAAEYREMVTEYLATSR